LTIKDNKKPDESGNLISKYEIEASGLFTHSGGDVATEEVLSSGISQFWEMP